MTRALVIGPGGLRGAYGGGVVSTLGRKLGCGYFDAVYGCSAGAYTGSYLVAEQPEMIEAIWRECVHGSLLMRPRNFFLRKGPILDLFYLNNVLRSEKYRLDTDKLIKSRTKLVMVATECESGSAQYFSPITREDFFLQVRASAAVPILHPRVEISKKTYIDGGLTDPLPIVKALADGHNEVVVVSNSSRFILNSAEILILGACALRYPGRRMMVSTIKAKRGSPSTLNAGAVRIRYICPSSKLPMRWAFDSSQKNINTIVDLGIHDALTFIHT